MTGAYAEEDLEAAGRQNEQYWYAKLGHVLDLTSLGATALSFDYMATEDQDANGNEGTSYSVAGVQFLDRIGTEIYAPSASLMSTFRPSPGTTLSWARAMRG